MKRLNSTMFRSNEGKLVKVNKKINEQRTVFGPRNDKIVMEMIKDMVREELRDEGVEDLTGIPLNGITKSIFKELFKPEIIDKIVWKNIKGWV